MMHKNIPLSLYIHIPWCEKKCPYCDFNSHIDKGDDNEDAYIAALITDLKYDLARFKTAINNRTLQSIFIGGGTPSLFSAESFKTLLTEIENYIPFSNDIEVTLEANPGSSETRKFVGFREAGINRLSIGVQSFNNQHLNKLGRVHNGNEAQNALQYARNAGFENINLDVMFGLSEQSLQECVDDITQAIELAPEHLSCYQLTIEPNTLFHHQPPPTPNDDKLWEMQFAVQIELANAGYSQYEVSAYASPKQQCQHNLNYWQFGDYLAIGAGAHGKLSDETSIHRYWKIKHPTQYLKYATTETIQKLTGKCEPIAEKDRAFEFMLNALRLKHGFELQQFEQRTGLSKRIIQPLLDKHLEQALIVINDKRVTPTERGYQVINSMLEDYLSLTYTH